MAGRDRHPRASRRARRTDRFGVQILPNILGAGAFDALNSDRMLHYVRAGFIVCEPVKLFPNRAPKLAPIRIRCFTPTRHFGNRLL
jgi:hypothetical protein